MRDAMSVSGNGRTQDESTPQFINQVLDRLESSFSVITLRIHVDIAS